MKRILMVCAGAALLLSVLWAGAVSAANVRGGESPRIMSDEVIDGTLYTAGSDIKIQGTVQGDVFCAGQNVEISGVVEGDVLCAAQYLTVSGEVHGDIRLAGMSVTVRGKVGGSASIAAQMATINDDATIGRDVNIAGQQLDVAGAIGRDVDAAGSTFITTATIGRDLGLAVEKATLARNAKIAGTFRYTSPDQATIEQGAQVAGSTEYTKSDETQKPAQSTVAAVIASALFGFFAFLLVGIAFLLLAPRAAGAASKAIITSPPATFGAGFLGLAGIPLLAIALFITVVGFLAGIVLLLVWVVSMLLAVVVAGQALGNIVVAKLNWQHSWRNVAGLALGLLILFLVALVPFAGGFIMFLAVVWGMGALWYTLIKSRGPATAPHAEVKKS